MNRGRAVSASAAPEQYDPHEAAPRFSQDKNVLDVANGYRVALPDLGRNQRFADLSEKQITRAVRDALRHKYGMARVWVSCEATFERDAWRGNCGIDGGHYDYRVLGRSG
jgi:hypothetical protein